MKKTTGICINSVFLIIFVAGCAKQKIRTLSFYSIPHLQPHLSDCVEEKQQIRIALKKLAQQECIDFFGVNTIKCGFQPIQITLRNRGDGSVYFYPMDMTCTITSPKKVAKHCHWKTKEIMLPTGVLAAIFYWPLLPSAAYCGMHMKKENEKITKKAFQRDIIHDYRPIKIAPMQTVSKIFFVEKDSVPKEISVVLFNKDTKTQLDFELLFP